MSSQDYHSVFISPHIDDAVFSCGGTLANACREGRALVISVFSDYGKKTSRRHGEDKKASQLFGYDVSSLGLPDLPQRNIFAKFPSRRHSLIRKKEEKWIQTVGERLSEFLQGVKYEKIYFPLGAGFHVDHEVCFLAGLRNAWSGELNFYEDVPYVLGPGILEERLYYLSGNFSQVDGRKPVFSLDQEIKPFVNFMLSRPFFSKITTMGLDQGVSFSSQLFLKRWKNRVESRKLPIPGLEMRPYYVNIDDYFEAKLKKLWIYESQARLFFHSKEEAHRMLSGFHYHKDNGKEGLFERFWKINFKDLSLPW